MLRIRLDYGNETGLVLAVALVFLVVLGVMGAAAVTMTGGILRSAAITKTVLRPFIPQRPDGSGRWGVSTR